MASSGRAHAPQASTGIIHCASLHRRKDMENIFEDAIASCPALRLLGVLRGALDAMVPLTAGKGGEAVPVALFQAGGPPAWHYPVSLGMPAAHVTLYPQTICQHVTITSALLPLRSGHTGR